MSRLLSFFRRLVIRLTLMAFLVVLTITLVLLIPGLLNQQTGDKVNGSNDQETAAGVARQNTASINPQVAVGAEDKLLVWLGDGAAPGQHSGLEPGQLVFIDGTGAVEPVMDVPEAATHVLACGDDATSPNGEYFGFYVGRDIGTLYLMTGIGTPVAIAEEVQALTCAGNSTFRFSPGSTRLAYLAFGGGVTVDNYPNGVLRFLNTETRAQEAEFRAVTAFELNDEIAAFITFFPNDTGEATEAAVSVWNGEFDREVATLFPKEDCRFTSAQVGIAPDGTLGVLMGHRCSTGDTRTSWQLYTVDPENRTASLLLSEFQTGAFIPSSRTNYVVFSPDGETLFFTVPDGVTTFTVGVLGVVRASVEASVIVPRNSVMPRYTTRPYAPENALPVRSADGRWLAVVTNTANSDATLTVIDLNMPELPPIAIPAGERGDIISTMMFTPDSSQLIFVAGGHSAADNSAFALDLETVSDFRIRRGRYAQGVISPDGQSVALVEWQKVEDEDQPPFQSLVVLDIESSAHSTLYVGAQVIEGKVNNPQFLFPLAWRQG